MSTRRRSNGTLPPNHLDKREQILEAATRVLLAEGPAGCTSRALAQETGMTKGLIHYYFGTMEEIVDTAMARLLDDLTAHIRAAGTGHDDPSERFWAVVEGYLNAFADEPGRTLLWFDYWLQMTRAGRSGIFESVQDRLIALLFELLDDAGVPEADVRARALFSYVIGTLVRREVRDVTFEELRPELASLSRIEAP
jgi:AcrR family transcriptional regulator